MKYSIEKVITLIGARRIGRADANIGWILTDCRSLCFPEETLFFALRSERNDGHNYIHDLYRRGVRNFVVEHVPETAATEYADANFLKVVSPRAALQRLAERHRDEFDFPVGGCGAPATVVQFADRCAAVGVADRRAYRGGAV